jgi:hypothetical protein
MASPNLVTSVRRAVKAMHWLSESDQATVDLAIRVAKAIEEADKLDARLGTQLLEALKELGGTPAARKALGAERQTKSRLAEIRALRSS